MFLNEKAEADIFKLVIGLFITATLVGALIPTALNSIISGAGANTSWSTGTLATYDALPILVVVAIVAVIASIAYKAFSE